MAEPYTAPYLAAVRVGAPADVRVRELTEHEQTAVTVVAGLVAALGLLGFVNSFARVAAAAHDSFGRLAFTVPVSVDVGIAVFSALDIVLARLDMRLRWLRLIPWSLTGATVYLNIAGETSVFGVVAHAVLPALWVAAIEVAAHVVRVRAGLTAGTRMDSIRLSRWLLAPVRTVRLWRRMVLWETRSYPAALALERDRVLALTDLQDAYGRLAWRWKAPRRTKALYQLGELAPATEVPALRSDGDPSVGDRTDRTSPKPPRGRSARSPRKRSRTKRRTVPNVDDLMPAGRRIAAEAYERGEPLTRDRLAAALRQAGTTAGNERVGALLVRLKHEPADAAETEGARQ